jgi:beta-glucosidase
VRAAARRTARESYVLLKNEGDALPVSDRHKRIALIGTWAQTDDDGSWYGPAELSKADTTSLRRALVARIKPEQTLTYVPGFADPCGKALADPDAAVAAAKNADLAIVVVSEDCEINGEGTSRANLDLSGAQQDLLARVASTGTPVALLVNTGRPLTLTRAAPLAKAILITWQGGTEGRSALAEVLFGEAAPSGKLPMTFPRSVGQLPLYYSHLPTGRPAGRDRLPWIKPGEPTGDDRYTSRYMDEETTPLYPFGWGLSYTTFAYANLKVAQPKVPLTGAVEVSFDLINTGGRTGTEVAQLYTHQPVASRSRPVRELKRFEKIELKAGETRRVTFKLPVQELGFHDDAANYRVEPGPFELYVGGSSLADLTANFEVVR